MTREQWRLLTKDEQKAKVMSFAGWKDFSVFKTAMGDFLVGVDPSDGFQRNVPDCVGDRNVMSEVERLVLSKENTWEHMTYKLYLAYLEATCVPAHMAFASAEQRAEAFVQAMEPGDGERR